MRIAVLGPLEVTAGRQAAEVWGTRLRLLLVRLALGLWRGEPR
ncbi:MAG TPA: hypothetical protein VFW50_05720 [Streptosporangiaceae bacterium]|nr:hypothetical protein [Streptosporangiaceae bacterium]